MTYTIHETCNCGAVFDYSETINKPTESALKEEHERFLEAHRKCYIPTLVEVNKK